MASRVRFIEQSITSQPGSSSLAYFLVRTTACLLTQILFLKDISNCSLYS